MSYWLIFLTGLSTGGLSCLAVQSGLLASAIAEDKESAMKSHRYRTISIFLTAKLMIYTFLGILLGIAGNFLAPTPKITAYLNIAIAFFMLGIAFDIVKIHPIFRYFVIQPPKFIRKKIRNLSKAKGDFTAFLLGLMTVLIPCGVTQAMIALAISSASALKGTLIMFIFTLGTIPLFFILGLITTKLNERYNQVFTKIIAIFLILISIYNTTNALRLLGVKLPHINLRSKSTKISHQSIIDPKAKIQKVEIKLNDGYGYDPNRIYLKVNIPAEVKLINDGARGCIRAFVIPNLNIQEYLNSDLTVFNFTPTKKGTIQFTCSMGMYYGEFIIQ